MFARLANLIGDRTKLEPEMSEAIEEVVMDSAKVKAIFEAAKSSMGKNLLVLLLLKHRH